jgi:hypothetical protein
MVIKIALENMMSFDFVGWSGVGIRYSVYIAVMNVRLALGS